MGITRNVAVSTAVGGTIITDTLALLVLAVIVAMVKGLFTDIFVLKLSISFIIFVIGIIGLFPIFTRWFFKNNDDSISQYIFVLAMVFLAGFFAQLAGVEPIIGAFLAGITLNRFIPNTSPLMNRINFVGNALFIPFFLIGIGMLINFKDFFGNIKTIEVGAVMTLVATIGKYSAAWLTQKTFGFNKDQRSVIFGLSNSQAAATLAAITVGYNIILDYDVAGMPIRLLDDNILNGTVLMILVTCVISSFATQRGASNLAISDSSTTTDEKQLNERILIPIHNIENTETLINLSITIKSKYNQSALNVLNIFKHSDSQLDSESQGRKIIERAINISAATDNKINGILRHDTNTLNGIVNVVKELKITDIILGLHKSSEITESFLGNLTENVLLKCHANTLIIRAVQPLATIKQTIVIIPDKAEKEIGFAFWVIKIWNIGRNLNTPLVFYANENCIKIINEIKTKHPVDAKLNVLEEWGKFDEIFQSIKPDDMIVFILSRRKCISYNPSMTKIPVYLEKHLKNNSVLLIYPLQTAISTDSEKDLNSLLNFESLKGNIEQLDDVGKEIVKLFWKK